MNWSKGLMIAHLTFKQKFWCQLSLELQGSQIKQNNIIHNFINNSSKLGNYIYDFISDEEEAVNIKRLRWKPLEVDE